MQLPRCEFLDVPRPELVEVFGLEGNRPTEVALLVAVGAETIAIAVGHLNLAGDEAGSHQGHVGIFDLK